MLLLVPFFLMFVSGFGGDISLADLKCGSWGEWGECSRSCHEKASLPGLRLRFRQGSEHLSNDCLSQRRESQTCGEPCPERARCEPNQVSTPDGRCLATCGPLPLPDYSDNQGRIAHGKYVITPNPCCQSYKSRDALEGTTVELECERGFEPLLRTGMKKATCSQSGTWEADSVSQEYFDSYFDSNAIASQCRHCAFYSCAFPAYFRPQDISNDWGKAVQIRNTPCHLLDNSSESLEVHLCRHLETIYRGLTIRSDFGCKMACDYWNDEWASKQGFYGTLAECNGIAFKNDLKQCFLLGKIDTSVPVHRVERRAGAKLWVRQCGFPKYKDRNCPREPLCGPDEEARGGSELLCGQALDAGRFCRCRAPLHRHPGGACVHQSHCDQPQECGAKEELGRCHCHGGNCESPVVRCAHGSRCRHCVCAPPYLRLGDQCVHNSSCPQY